MVMWNYVWNLEQFPSLPNFGSDKQTNPTFGEQTSSGFQGSENFGAKNEPLSTTFNEEVK
jgi:hypothetical protein